MSDLDVTSIDWQIIEGLDFELVKIKLIDKTEGLGWSLDRCNDAEKWYKRFLYLCKKNPSMPLVPVGDIDKFWHQHILDTEKYAKDCDKIFGFFLHHFPYFGMRSQEDATNLKRAVEETSKIFKKEYGESPIDVTKKFTGKSKKSTGKSKKFIAKCMVSCFFVPKCSNP